MNQNVKPPVGFGTVAPLKNVAAAYSVAVKLIERPIGVDGLGLFFGRSGYGKTKASMFVQNKTNALYLEVFDYWTRRKFCQSLLAELGIDKPKGSIPDMMDQALRLLQDDPNRLLIIDEADKLIDKGMIELVRDIYKGARIPILLVGEELLPDKLSAYERCITPEAEASDSGAEINETSQGVAEDGEAMDDAVQSLVITAGAESVEELLRFAELGKRMTDRWVDLGGDPANFLSELKGFAEDVFVGVDLAKPGSDLTSLGIYSPNAGHRPFRGMRVTSKVEGFRRAGIVHSKAGRDFYEDELTPEQVRLIVNDPGLTVELL